MLKQGGGVTIWDSSYRIEASKQHKMKFEAKTSAR
jgi:hypothetical protein